MTTTSSTNLSIKERLLSDINKRHKTSFSPDEIAFTDLDEDAGASEIIPENEFDEWCAEKCKQEGIDIKDSWVYAYYTVTEGCIVDLDVYKVLYITKDRTSGCYWIVV